MRTLKQVLISTIVVAALFLPSMSVQADANRGKVVSMGEDGSVCYEQDVKDAEKYLARMESLEKAGKIKEAYEAATPKVFPDCMPENGDDRMFDVMFRTYRKLGQSAEKAGRLHEAFEYYIYPFDKYFAPGGYRDREKDYSLADANRTMIAWARTCPDDYKVVQEATGYFDRWEVKPPELKEVKGMAVRGGDKLLAKEEKSFAAHKYKQSYEELKSAREWYTLAKADKRANDRGGQRAQTLLAEGTYNSVEQAFNYVFEFHGNLDAARSRARALGEQAEHKGDLELARQFYGLSGDDARSEALSNKLDAAQAKKEKQAEQAESKRKEQFGKDQKALEDELGF